MAAFEVIIYGRFWVITEAPKLPSQRKERSTMSLERIWRKHIWSAWNRAMGTP